MGPKWGQLLVKVGFATRLKVTAFRAAGNTVRAGQARNAQSPG